MQLCPELSFFVRRLLGSEAPQEGLLSQGYFQIGRSLQGSRAIGIRACMDHEPSASGLGLMVFDEAWDTPGFEFFGSSLGVPGFPEGCGLQDISCTARQLRCFRWSGRLGIRNLRRAHSGHGRLGRGPRRLSLPGCGFIRGSS